MGIGPQYSKRKKIKIIPVWNMQMVQRLKYILYIYILYIITQHTHLSNLQFIVWFVSVMTLFHVVT